MLQTILGSLLPLILPGCPGKPGTPSTSGTSGTPGGGWLAWEWRALQRSSATAHGRHPPLFGPTPPLQERRPHSKLNPSQRGYNSGRV
ncbi:hypothetical protein GQ53DRAFT_526487 [Thozetella sp. PMI_491]|nr:hypothetical protein GQ53DRAFT_526487 [Thozetella sp. PMI_491]